ncbi:MAG: cation diffusion facilitator family transporter [Verrucomicrobia bacterium]|nr:cation diffusion facilitator family transporter [Verrucomicrobiota bacterium]
MNGDIQRKAAEGQKVILTGVLLNLILSTGKIAGGLLGRSNALIADGIESLLDLFSSLLMWAALKYAAKPPDEDHPYGHGKAESLSSLIGSLVLAIAGALIAHNSIIQLIAAAHGAPVHLPSPWTLLILIGVIALKETLYQFMARRARKIGSNALLADAWHHRSDAVTSIAAFIGISISLLGGRGYEVADDWAALFACVVIFYSSYNMLKLSLGDVMDARVSPDAEKTVMNITCSVPGVISAEKCRIRKSGLSYIADLHIRVGGDISVREGHAISHLVKDKLMTSELPLEDVTVHVEPEEG